jgi:hypothetical protein
VEQKIFLAAGGEYAFSVPLHPGKNFLGAGFRVLP